MVKNGRQCGKIPILFYNDDVVIELIENVLNVSKEDLLTREDYYIKQYGFYNSYCSSKTLSKEKAKQREKEYREKNKERIKQWKKQWYIKNKKK